MSRPHPVEFFLRSQVIAALDEDGAWFWDTPEGHPLHAHPLAGHPWNTQAEALDEADKAIASLFTRPL